MVAGIVAPSIGPTIVGPTIVGARIVAVNLIFILKNVKNRIIVGPTISAIATILGATSSP